MEHPDFTIGAVLIEDRAFTKGQRPNNFYLAPNRQTILDNNILNCGLRINAYRYSGTKKMITDLACLAPQIGSDLMDLFGQNLVCGYQLRSSWEQQPVRDNHISLGHEKDQFDIPRTNLHWRKNALDLKTVRQSGLLFGEYLARNNLGRLLIDKWVLGNENYPEDDGLAGNHHMGGTRMALSADKGVVDSDCKVFGQENLFIAGSSVFPSCGFSNPTLSIIQLALRLSKHLQGRLG